ncbi:tyrosinase family oxidase copper chaperone [Actinoplanes sp. NEAU-A12]|uniref:Tyrosinase family oxidase copper chaperone n=1 Tax=Actinoplanes sandaracinus TaxID=3045177 RepID=A0ABT6WGW1_9ACTN|nr:tyrosinase family oxidase copper chaperone [Actinoplanes sandaracinus]MDI6098970.1 tyrosinase family oxidase copper chaperone [Actinoplanes sandaracinus]
MNDINRRDVLRYGAAGAVTAATALAAGQALAGPKPIPLPLDPRDFDELYKGRRIRGRLLGLGRDELHINNKKLALTAISTLFFPEDGSEPYVAMGYISAINHYDPVEIVEGRNQDCLKKLSRKVVDILGDLELGDEAAKGHQH